MELSSSSPTLIWHSWETPSLYLCVCARQISTYHLRIILDHLWIYSFVFFSTKAQQHLMSEETLLKYRSSVFYNFLLITLLNLYFILWLKSEVTVWFRLWFYLFIISFVLLCEGKPSRKERSCALNSHPDHILLGKPIVNTYLIFCLFLFLLPTDGKY